MQNEGVKNKPRRARDASGSLAYYNLLAGMNLGRTTFTLNRVPNPATNSEQPINEVGDRNTPSE